MKATIGRKFPIPITNLSNGTKQTLIPFSSSSGGGRGRGRGGSSSSDPSPFEFTPPRAPGQPQSDTNRPELPDRSTPPGLGHGRGKPLPSSPTLPSFSSFISSVKSTPAGRGRVTNSAPSQPPDGENGPDSVPKKPMFFVREDSADLAPRARPESVNKGEGERVLPESLISVLSGAGRGKTVKQQGPEAQINEENRYLRERQSPTGNGAGGPGRGSGVASPRMSREKAVQNAVRILSRGGGNDGITGGEDDIGGGRGGEGRGRGGFRGRGGRWGRGGREGRGRGGVRWRDRGGESGRIRDAEDGHGAGLYLGDNADGEKLAQKIGTEHMNELTEAFEELSGSVLPSPVDDAYIDAMHTNYMIECEPEYLIGEFDSNPDIDEKPPISLRDALEKMKPFLMAYEGIQSQEEWEQIIEETMERVPLMKEIVDYYSGPDRVTAKQQQEELESVAKTLPQSAPDSVKQFTNRAVLSLQSNPGWGWDKKCQFMDKLVQQVSHHYK